MEMFTNRLLNALPSCTDHSSHSQEKHGVNYLFLALAMPKSDPRYLRSTDQGLLPIARKIARLQYLEIVFLRGDDSEASARSLFPRQV